MGLHALGFRLDLGPRPSAPMCRRILPHVLYLALSLLVASRFFPLTNPTSHAITVGDPALEAWVLQWMSHAIVTDPLHWYAGNTFHPYPHAVLLSDPLVPLAILNVPVRWFTSNPWVGYNLLIVLAYYWSCLSGAALARLVTGSNAVAVWGGLFWGFLFYRVHHIGHLQILSFQWIPAAVVCLVRVWQRPAWRTAMLFVLTFVAQALVSWYLAVVTTVVIAVVAALRPGTGTPGRSLVKYYAAIAVAIVVVVGPFAIAYRAGFADSTLGARGGLVNTFGDAVHLRDYLTPPTATLAGSRIAGNPYWIWGENTLYVGFVPLALAFAGLFTRTRWALIGAALVAAGYVLSLGYVSPSLGIRLPLHYLARLLPFVAGLRATQRFSLVLYAGILLLSSLGLARLVGAWRWRRQAAAVAVASGLFLVEVFPVSLPVSAAHEYSVSAPDRFIAKYQRARREPLVVLHLPIHYFREAYPVSEATYMVDSTWHWARILNGFSGGEPLGFIERMRVLNTLPDPAAVRLVRELGVDLIAVHGAAAGPGNPLWEFFSRQEWADVVRCSSDDFVVLVKR
jgi:hypothetical protein